jgi:hypothetical protein
MSRLVLAVARTVTASARLLDLLEVFHSDFRIRVVFVIDAHSRFSDGVAELLQAVGARVVTYSQLPSLDIDLVITTSSTAEVGPGNAPVLVVPHGVGYHKYLLDDPTGVPRLSGVVSATAAQRRRIIQVLTAENQRGLLAVHRPEVTRRAVVIRDPFLDRMRASQQLREQYRRSLGVGDRKLVVMSSTWGEQSLFARWQRLPAQLLGQLPADDYAVAAILHPNVWYGNGPWQVRTWLADARDAGLILVPPTEGWQAALASADTVIGDHGSVTFYAAALDLPLLLGAFGNEVVPGTPMAELGAFAPRLDWEAPLHPQIEQVAATHEPDTYARTTRMAFGNNDTPNLPLRTLIYQTLKLSEPDGAQAVRAWPAPVVTQTQVTAHAIYSETTSDGTVRLSRFPAAVDDADLQPTGSGRLRHLSVYAEELDLGRRQSASTMTYRDVEAEPTSADEVAAWIAARPQEQRLIAVQTRKGLWVNLRHRGLVLGSASRPTEPMLITAVVYHLLLTDHLPQTGRSVTARVAVGARTFGVTVAMMRPDPN